MLKYISTIKDRQQQRYRGETIDLQDNMQQKKN